MITVDISVPVIGKTYDFSIDENTSVETITEEIVDLIIQKEAYSFQDISQMHLFFANKKTLLNPAKSLYSNGVDNGDRLILV
ncbi:MAG: EsaB/YukD family protein [Clostridia bacterium]|nr:EsaB/YukD family protein [Clostridia bacterium]